VRSEEDRRVGYCWEEDGDVGVDTFSEEEEKVGKEGGRVEVRFGNRRDEEGFSSARRGEGIPKRRGKRLYSPANQMTFSTSSHLLPRLLSITTTTLDQLPFLLVLQPIELPRNTFILLGLLFPLLLPFFPDLLHQLLTPLPLLSSSSLPLPNLLRRRRARSSDQPSQRRCETSPHSSSHSSAFHHRLASRFRASIVVVDFRRQGGDGRWVDRREEGLEQP